MFIFSLLSLLISIVYPVIASCRAFEDYTQAVNILASQNLKIGGVTVPLNLFFLRIDKESDGNDVNHELAVQRHLISLQKWFIYWIVLAVVSIGENLLFLSYLIPGYSILKLGFNVWLIIPMLLMAKEDVDTTVSTFDNTEAWRKFTQSGAGLLFFTYIKPWIEHHIEILRKVEINPLEIIKLANVMSYLAKSQEVPLSTSGVNEETSMLDSSFVMVMNMKNKWTGMGISSRDISDEKTKDDFDVIEDSATTQESSSIEATNPSNAITRKRGYFW